MRQFGRVAAGRITNSRELSFPASVCRDTSDFWRKYTNLVSREDRSHQAKPSRHCHRSLAVAASRYRSIIYDIKIYDIPVIRQAHNLKGRGLKALILTPFCGLKSRFV